MKDTGLEIIRFVRKGEPLPDGYMTVEQASRFIGLSDERVRQLIDEGRIHASRQKSTVGREGWRWLIDTGEASRFKKVREADPGQNRRRR